MGIINSTTRSHLVGSFYETDTKQSANTDIVKSIDVSDTT